MKINRIEIAWKIGLLAFFFLSIAFTIKTFLPQKLALTDAIKSKTVTAQVLSNGKYSGNSVNMTLINLTNLPIQILVPAGTKYNTEDPGEQTLIQMEDHLIVINAKGSYTGKLAAFCSEATDRCPTENNEMKITVNTDPRFNKLFAYIKDKSIDKSTFQDAVWAISDNRSVSNIVAENKTAEDFRVYVAVITGQKNTWFTSPQQVQVDDAGNFNYETVIISGKLEFDCTKGKNVHQDIHKENGEVRFKSDKTMTAQTGHITYTFKLSVKGWEKGNYYVNIHDGTNKLAKFEFSI